MGVVGRILSKGGKLTICVLEEEGSCEVLDFLERQKRSNRAYFGGMIALIQHVSGMGLPLHNKRMAEMVGTRPPKEIVEIKKGNLRLFGFIDPRRPGILILAHGWMKSQGNVRRQNDQIAKAEEIFARYKQMPEVPIERGGGIVSLQDRITALYEGVEDDPEYLTAAFVIDITEEICRRMDEAGLTQREVARRLGTSQAYIAKVLNNNPNMTVRSLIALADAVGLKLDGVRLVDKNTGWLYAETGSRQLARWSGASYLVGNTKTAVFSDADYTTVEPLPVEREYPDERIADAA